MAVIISEHKCITCRHFDRGENECTKGIICLNLLTEHKVVSECYDWEDKEAENEQRFNQS